MLIRPVNVILPFMHNPEIYEGPIMVRGKGTGFLNHPDLTEDIIIEREALGFALDGDIVKVKLKKKIPGKRQEGTVVEVIKAAYRELIGNVKEKNIDGKTVKYLQPDNSRIHIRPILPDATGNDLGMKVVVEIVKWTEPLLDPVAKITEVIGRAGDHETEMQAIIRSGGFSKNFPESVSQAAQELYNNKDQIFADALLDPKRRDLRHLITMTIDPADAKDFDDALSCQMLENGIELDVKLPNKRVKGLEMLSGGERALTSIALIFAMSQVNPPPFIILDETDAALDEANSRRYGDMIEELAKRSQLILITHNRETMSRAGVLYGVTMGGDGVSKLLSIKLDEAVAVAK